MNQTINIVKLIEENPNTKLSKPYKGKLLSKLKDNFSTTEQQLFISSFYCYLNYKSDDFVIDLDDIWNWLGFTRKDNAKTVLERHFVKDVNYQTKNIFPAIAGKGRPSEKIMLSIKTFKKMCLKANTSKANEIHEYYLKLEETLHEVIDEESNELRLQLEQKDAILEIQDDELLRQSNHIKLLEIKTLKRAERLEHGKNAVYLITNEYLSRERIFIIGKSISLANRMSQYNKNAEHDVVYYTECNNAKQMSLIEEIILYKLDKYRERANRDRFILPENSEISLFTDIINKVYNLFDDVNEDVVIERLNDDKDKEYYEDNKEYIKEYKKQYHEENKEQITIKNKAWYEENKEKVKIYNEQYRDENKEKIKEQKKIYKEAHIEEYKERNSAYYRENIEDIQMKKKLYQKENEEHILKHRKEYYGKNIEEIRAKDRARNPKVACDCGLMICKRSIPVHKKSKTHERFLKEKIDKSNVDTKVEENDLEI